MLATGETGGGGAAGTGATRGASGDAGFSVAGATGFGTTRGAYPGGAVCVAVGSTGAAGLPATGICFGTGGAASGGLATGFKTPTGVPHLVQNCAASASPLPHFVQNEVTCAGDGCVAPDGGAAAVSESIRTCGVWAAACGAACAVRAAVSKRCSRRSSCFVRLLTLSLSSADSRRRRPLATAAKISAGKHTKTQPKKPSSRYRSGMGSFELHCRPRRWESLSVFL